MSIFGWHFSGAAPRTAMRGGLKLLLFAACLFAAVGVCASPMAAEQPLTKNIVVANRYFSCTFFPRHMFPVWFKKPDGTKFPESVRFLDRLVIGKLHYLLFADLWAEQKILENTEDEFAIRCSGVYVRITGDTVAPGDARAVYTYRIRRDSPIIRVDAEITRTDEAPAQLHFLEPAFSMRLDFDRIRCDGKSVPLEQAKAGIGAIRNVTFIKDGCQIGVTCKDADAAAFVRYQSSVDGFSSMCAYRRRFKKRSVKLTGFLRVERK